MYVKPINWGWLW